MSGILRLRTATTVDEVFAVLATIASKDIRFAKIAS
jgi:hypothetical protein